MSNKNNIEKLLLRLFSNSATKEELEYINEWKKSSINNYDEFYKYKRIWLLWESFSKLSHINTEKALLKVHNNISTSKEKPLFKAIRLVAVVLLPLLIVSNAYFISNKYISNSKITPNYKVVSAHGVRTKVLLPDSSIVWLNAGSTLNYPAKFNKKQREVKLTGEGYFDIVKKEGSPFYVSLGNVYVKVLGTTFNIKMYPDEDRIETTLLTGKVSLVKRDGNKEVSMVKMKPDQHLIYNKKDNKLLLKTMSSDNNQNAGNLSRLENISLKKAKALVNKHSSWIGGRLIFRNDSMDEVVRRLERWYNVNIELSGEDVKQYHYTATFTEETLEQVLKFLEISAPIKYKITNEKIIDPNNYSKKKVTIYSNNIK